MVAEPDRMAAEEDAAWMALLAAFRQVPPDRLEESRLTSGGWSPKDAMFHVAAWCAEAANQLERMRLGTYVDPLIDTDTRNGEWFEISHSLDLPTVKAELHASRTMMRRQWCALCEQGELTPDAIEWFEESGEIHYRGHGGELLVWLRGSEAPA